MGLQGALFSGVSGLTTYSDVISVIGNNIANVNTPAFKEGRANFFEVLTSASASEPGQGVKLNSIDRLFTQGGFQSTAVPTDLAIDGEGFFIVVDPITNATLFTRTGDFRVNADGDLVNSTGQILQGFDPARSSTSALPFAENINLGGQSFPPSATSSSVVTVNLDANAPSPGVPFDATDAAGTSNFSTALTLFDSLGNGHTAELYFQKQPSPANTWNWFAASDVSDLTGTGLPAAGPATLARGEMTFTDAGALDTVRTLERIDYSTGALASLGVGEQGANVVFDFTGGAATGQNTTFDFGTPLQLFDSGTGTFSPNPATPTGLEGSTQFGAPSVAVFQSQNGFSSGVLQSFNVNRQGIVQGLFSNGQSRDLFQLALSRFPNPGALNPVGNSLYSQSSDSGEPVVAAPGAGGLGNIVASALETSNVDLSTQFVELIRAQQAFQANARVITTSDELLTEVVNLRR